MTVREITSLIEDAAPLALQENYDNAGLLVGNHEMEVSGVLLSIDITEAVIDEAVQHDCNLIISHHPLIFRGLKNLTGQDYIQRCIIKAIKNDISIYAAHTNIDNVLNGVNGKIADKIHLQKRSVLIPKTGMLLKLATFVPTGYADIVRNALFNAGAGQIGEYDSCSFNTNGTGTFRPSDNANPFAGQPNEFHTEFETRIEVILPVFLKTRVVNALIQSHPYEEPAFDIIPLLNTWNKVGSGIVGELKHETDEMDLLMELKNAFALETLRHSPLHGKKIKKVAICGGAGSEFIPDAISKGADVFISGDIKYHDFFNGENKILIVDIGHYESEQYTKDVFYEIITKKIPNFAVRISEVNTNPINYY